MKNNLIAKLKDLDIVHREPVILSSGTASDFYIDVKKAYGYPEALGLICDYLWDKIDKRATCIAAIGYGGIIPASVLAHNYNINLTLVRDVPKKHGLRGWIDGYLPTEQDKLIIIDDVYTTGKSLRKIIDILTPTRADILGCYVVVRRGKADFELPLSYLLDVQELISG